MGAPGRVDMGSGHIVGRLGVEAAAGVDGSSFADLVAGRIAVAHARAFAPPAECRSAVHQVLEMERLGAERDDTLVAKMPLPVADDGPDGATALDGIGRRVQEALHGLAPVPPGRQGPRLRAVLRLYRTGSRLRPHIDRSIEPGLEAVCAGGRYAANLYLSSAGGGGALLLWSLALPAAEYEPHRFLELADFVARFGPPALRIVPRTGDLIIFNSEQVHAVETLEAGLRVTLSTFLGVDRAGHVHSFC